MNAEVLIRARKVFVNDTIVENREVCPHCASKGQDFTLRYYYISLEEAIYKCGNASCLYPFERFIFKSLSDKSVYYYEEVLDGGREAYLRVPLDGQPIYETANPLSTQTFCDTQRNPNIESYDCDFTDLLNEINFEPTPDPTPPYLPPIADNDFNPDILEFLDDTAPKSEDLSTVLNANGLENLLNDLIQNSPAKSESLPESMKEESSEPSSDATLSKCLKHIEKVKNVKTKKSRDKSKETFTSAIKKARQNQQSAAASTAIKSNAIQIKKEVVSDIPNPKAQVQSTAIIKSAIKSANTILRPTELARAMLDSTKINSGFLRQYMKNKEEKLFANEAKLPEKSIQAPRPQRCFALPTLIPEPIGPNIDSPATAPPAIEKTPTVPKVASNRKSIKIETTNEDEKPVKKEPKPRGRPKAIVVKTEPLNDSNSTEKEDKISKRRSVSKKTPKQNSTIDENTTSNETVTETPKRRYIRKKSLPADSDASTTENNEKEKKPAVKRTRKKANDSESSIVQSETPKPKRKRTSKSIPILPPIVISDAEPNVEGDSKIVVDSTTTVGNPTLNASAPQISPHSILLVDTESSSEPLLGFSEKIEENSKENVHFLRSVRNVKDSFLAVELKEENSPVLRATRKRSQEKTPKRIDTKRESDSIEKSTSKRSKGNETPKPVPTKEIMIVPRNKPTTKPRKKSARKSTAEVEKLPSFAKLLTETNTNHILPDETGGEITLDVKRECLEEAAAASASEEQREKVSPTYYVRKLAKFVGKPEENINEIDKVIDEWDDDGEKEPNETKSTTIEFDMPTIEMRDTDDVISVTSETSDASAIEESSKSSL